MRFKNTRFKKSKNQVNQNKTKKLIAQFNIETAQNFILNQRAKFILFQMEERIRLSETREEIDLAIRYGKRNLSKKILRTYADEKLRIGGWNLYNRTKEGLARIFGEDWVKKQLNIKELLKEKKIK